MATLPMFQQRTLARRRASDIDILAKQYKQHVEQMTGQYQQAFGDYQAKTSEQLKTFEAQSSAYKTAFEKYNAEQLTPYQVALDEYNKKAAIYSQEIQDISAGKLTKYVPLTTGYDSKNQYYSYLVDPVTGRQMNTSDALSNPEKYGYSSILTPVQGGNRGKNIYTLVPLPRSENPSAPKAPEAFAEKAPEAPTLGEFDTTQFDEQRSQLETTFKREVGERKAGRLAAVSRRVARPLLQG